MTADEPDDRAAARVFYGEQQRRRQRIQYLRTGKVEAGAAGRKSGTPRPGAARDAAAVPTQPGLLLRVLTGRAAERTIKLHPGALTIGRASDAAIQLDDDTVSHYHAALTVTIDHVTVEDLGSTNGTSVNGTAIGEAHRLRPGDRLQLGNVVLVIEDSRG